ncbi:calcium-binding protein [Yoonia litorea]|uniref:Hemolysin-type calcium-binding repeat-containing protein n=1 Tax=Yoonia litorea TaxID=1123755 RepID=A0A1I6L920_9RHOB|nr:calcium-binding protein [Yoonia litorea]SFR99728.1 Hemolysin-type calcium-binding repeat-containing protein [Yoonia litorea]
MSVSLVLLVLLGGALLIPLIGDDGDDGANEIKGGPENDELNGTPGPDLIRAFLGDDVINGNGGEDDLRGGDGEDTITGGADRDVIDGGSENDQLFGLGGNDTIEGDAGDDFIDAGEGNDIVRGGNGNDTIVGNLGTDTLRGEGGDDDIFLWGDEGRAYGGQENDELVMVTGRGVLDGVAGENTFYALANDDDAQQTVAIIQELDFGDEIVMTIDTDDGSVVDKDLIVTVTEGSINGIDGYNIEVGFADPGDEPDNFETSRAFVYGTSRDIDDVVASIKVDVTVDAELSVAGAQETFAAVKAGATAPAQVSPTPVV